MEKFKKIPTFESNVPPRDVLRVTKSIHLLLMHTYQIAFEAQHINSHVEFMFRAGNGLSVETFSTIAEECAMHGVQISFNLDEQVMKVSPILN
jgi:hypothetical protein